MRRRKAWERVGGSSGPLPEELVSFTVWCSRRGFDGWEAAGDDPCDFYAEQSVFDVWCEERRQWAAEHGYWPGDPEDNGDKRLDDLRIDVPRLAEELTEALKAVPDMPWDGTGY